ncbi:DUF3253 domain-containing protein [Alcaligenaceae bacterium A4P071]|nr:DUF3253 domain-containing protein [Alcaligenaceae bacterium A4P071]
MTAENQRIERLILDLLGKRDASSSICPSEVARAMSDDEATWRSLMPKVRAVAAAMQAAGRLRITRGDATVTPATLDHGPIRLRRGKGFP